MKRVLIAFLIIFAMAGLAIAETDLTSPVTNADTSKMKFRYVKIRSALEAGRLEVGIGMAYGDTVGGTFHQHAKDDIVITDAEISIRGLNSQDTLIKADNDFASFPTPYDTAPATKILSELRAKSATYGQANDDSYLEVIVKTLIGL